MFGSGVLVAVSALVFTRVGDRWLPAAWFRQGDRPLARIAGWSAAIVLIAYGTILTIVGLLVQSGALDATSDADQRALAWHAFFWTLIPRMGLALAATLRWSRRLATGEPERGVERDALWGRTARHATSFGAGSDRHMHGDH